ncbi:hypothetical protein HII31_10496 [Pseudocercospora fuligena]|uniref:Transcription factor domain-containing protein n=1 Tax=Pseudocercospora fuligena TaxID=685502 RepID=A0A8H6RDT7_9PEZI|nr:hypothetical protein HII31_10496 [Pseudocercospora fuligena]
MASAMEEWQNIHQELVFVEHIPKDGGPGPQNGVRSAQRTTVRAQAARAGSDARLETIRQRAKDRNKGRPKSRTHERTTHERTRTLPHGQQVFSIRSSSGLKNSEIRPPRITTAIEQYQHTFHQYKDRETSVTLHAHEVLGGTIPLAQANVAFVGQFLHRFRSGPTKERPWVDLVMDEASASRASSLVLTALQANANALCGNDLQQPEIHRHASKLYLSAIRQVQSQLKGPNWHDPVVMYTCMVMTLFECILTNDPSATHAHIRGVSQLIQQKGPQSFSHGLEHRTFRYYRITILMLSLGDRQPSFLAEEQWKTVPYSGDGPPKTVLDQLADILAEIPGLLFAVDTIAKGGLGRYVLIRKAFELTYWVRCLIYDLERWKAKCIWTYPTLRQTSGLGNLNLIALCELCTEEAHYDTNLGEALDCYMAIHLILARIASGLAERSFILKTALRPPHSICDLAAGIALISEKNINSGASMVSMAVITFALKVAQSTTELDKGQESKLFEKIQDSLCQIKSYFARKYNINYCPPDNETGREGKVF